MSKESANLRLVKSMVCFAVAWGAEQHIAIASTVQSPHSGSVVISELMPNISETDVDWIEFYNHSQTAVDLKGCTLTDDQNDKLTFDQPLIIAPNSYAVIASGKSEEANQPAALTNLAYQFSADDFQLSAGPDQVELNCHGSLVDRVTYQNYRPGPATGSRGWQLEPNSLSSAANDELSNWCYTGLPILSEINLYGKNKVASPGRANPACSAKALPYLYINNQQAVLIEGIDFDETLKIARQELTRDIATAELTIWALRDQVITPDVARIIAGLYRDNIDKLYHTKPFTVIDWNHAVWHFAWAIANLYRNGDDAVKAELQEVYEDAITRPQTLDKFQLVATDNVLSHEILMGDAHEPGHAFAQGHIVVPGNADYVQSYEEYLENRRSDFSVSVINALFNLKVFFSD
ncbi:MAG: hypothetical protein ACJA2O_003688 [Candidatus Azotimanducaceae bacterium]